MAGTSVPPARGALRHGGVDAALRRPLAVGPVTFAARSTTSLLNVKVQLDSQHRDAQQVEYALCSFGTFRRLGGRDNKEKYRVTIECTAIDDLDGLEQIVKDVPFAPAPAAPNVMIAFTSEKYPRSDASLLPFDR